MSSGTGGDVSGPDIELVVPAHNEASRLAEALAPQLDYFAGRARFTVVLDHCTDDTEDVVRALAADHPEVGYFVHTGEPGKGAAVHAGFVRSTADIVGFMDADCPTPPVEIDRLISALADHDGAVASRYLPGSLIASPRTPIRTLASRLLNVAVRGLFGMPYRDTQCGAKVFHRRSIEPLLPEVSTHNWLYDVDLLLAARMSRLQVAEVPVIWCEREGSHLDVVGFAPEAALSLARLWMRARRNDRYSSSGRGSTTTWSTPSSSTSVWAAPSSSSSSPSGPTSS